MILCYDTADLNFQGGVPADAPAIMFYLDGKFRNEEAARRRFPHLFNTGRAIGLTVLQRLPAEGDDFEPGNARGNIAIWVVASHHRGVRRPLCYGDESDMDTLILPELRAVFGNPLPPPGPNRPFRTLLAHPDGIADIPPEHDGKQFFFSSIQGHDQGDLDKSVLRDDFFDTPSRPPSPNPTIIPIEGTGMITCGLNAEGDFHVFRENKDGSVDYTYQLNGQTGWNGGQAGVRIAGFHPFAPAPSK